jgi:hypothetical protein
MGADRDKFMSADEKKQSQGLTWGIIIDRFSKFVKVSDWVTFRESGEAKSGRVIKVYGCSADVSVFDAYIEVCNYWNLIKVRGRGRWHYGIDRGNDE